jgi:hypothetical protein
MDELTASMAQDGEFQRLKAQLTQIKQKIQEERAADEAYFTERQERRLASKDPKYVYFS